jgi:hypothetical protein
VALAAVAGAVAWAIGGLPGGPAACFPAGCDCEAAGPGNIRQPANAWSSLAIAAGGVAFLASTQSRGFAGLTAGGALVGAGILAFLAHAGLTAWAARLDGIGVAFLVGALALWRWWGQSLPPPWRRGRRGRPPAAEGASDCLSGAGGEGARRRTWMRWKRRLDAAPPSGGGMNPRQTCVAAFPPPSLLPAAAAGRRDEDSLALAATPSRHAGRGHLTLLSWLLLAAGGLFWALGRSGGPWCRPSSLLQAHAAWHLLAAAAIVLWLHAGRPTGNLPTRIFRLPLASGREEQAAP